MTTISAHMVADSVGVYAPRLSTLLLRYPLVIHAELMTHRAFSRNAASMRAIPIEKMIKATLDDPFVPVVWTKDQPGMQGHQELEGSDLRLAKSIWVEALTSAVKQARRLTKTGAHKQVVNRLLSPFAHFTVVVSSTQWSNWDALRRHPAAEPHIQILANKIKVAMDASTPKHLNAGEWHLPFVNVTDANDEPTGLSGGEALENGIKLSVARCASTSYKTVDGFEMTLERAMALHDKLAGSIPMHASPFEHQAKALHHNATVPWNGNFAPGWAQYRKSLHGECQ